MEKVIEKIIDIEHEAQGLVAEGYAQAEQIRICTLEDLKDMDARISKMSEKKINQLYKDNRKDADNRIASINEQKAMKMRLLEETVLKNRDMWENQIYNRILGR